MEMMNKTTGAIQKDIPENSFSTEKDDAFFSSGFNFTSKS